MPLLSYPTILTDPEWKKLEKALKLSNTGVGAKLRGLENAHKTFDTALLGLTTGRTTRADAQAKRTALQTSANEAFDAANDVWQKYRNKGPMYRPLNPYRMMVSSYLFEVQQFDLNSRECVNYFNRQVKKSQTATNMAAVYKLI